MNYTEEKTIGEMVAEDYRAAAVFQSFGIDFCCKGSRTIHEACEMKNINAAEVEGRLAELAEAPQSQDADFKSWSPELLADHIQMKHHKYINEKTPVLQQFLSKLCKVHGDRHPELHEIAGEFNQSAGELAMHMKKEELVLFPYIGQLVRAKAADTAIHAPHFGTVENPIGMMRHEHDIEGGRFRRISELTDSYTAPADGCNTYRVAYAMLKEFEDDLHLHIHLENNILFPKAIALEQELMS